MARETWTDERLDDLTKHMDENFLEVRTELRQQRAEMTTGFESVRGEIGEVRGEIGEVRGEIGEVREELGGMRAEVKDQRETMDAKFDAMNRTLQIGFGLIGAVLTGILGMLAAQL